MTTTSDLLIIGGGINGAGIAADAAGRGLNVVLCEQHDLASATSSASSKLIHGGLRYLENYEFQMVYKALQERDRLLRSAPHLIQPLRFVIPHNYLMRRTTVVQLGLFLYSYLGGRTQLARPRKLKLHSAIEGIPLSKQFDTGFSYYDCKVDDARLVITNAICAQENGAKILTHTKFVNATRHRDYWDIELKNKNGTVTRLQSRAIVNAAGPWVNELQHVFENHTHKPMRLVKGSHILMPKLYEGDFAYVLQNADNRIVFVIPFHGRYSLIGTTEEDYQGDPSSVTISQQEIDYLCRSVNNYFNKTLDPAQIVWHYAGVRPLLFDPMKEMSRSSREYQIGLDSSHTTAPLVTVFGGKITTYRLLAEEVLNQLKPFFPKLGPQWTAKNTLPGGDINTDSLPKFTSQLQIHYPWLSFNLATRYAQSYGSRCHLFLKKHQSLDDLGQHFGSGLYQAEVEYLVNHEWAQSASDILWRRSKLGLYLSQNQQLKLTEWLT